MQVVQLNTNTNIVTLAHHLTSSSASHMICDKMLARIVANSVEQLNAGALSPTLDYKYIYIHIHIPQDDMFMGHHRFQSNQNF
jgi:hypothetical protein